MSNRHQAMTINSTENVNLKFRRLLLPVWAGIFLLIPVTCEMIGMLGKLVWALAFGPIVGYFVFVSTLVLGFLFSCAALFCLAFSEVRPKALLILQYSIVAFVCVIAGQFLLYKLQDFESYLVIEHARPLISAIKKFEEEKHTTPENLEQLVPKYIAKIPEVSFTTFGAYALEPGIPWKLIVDKPCRPFDRYYMFYSPYEERSDGRKIMHEPGDWSEYYDDW